MDTAENRPLTQNEMKHAAADALLRQTGTLLEFWTEMGDPRVTAEFARECFARWLKDLPGDGWDTRLDST